jgi:predicted HAD superfamily Cof-like phosphohydrolase
MNHFADVTKFNEAARGDLPHRPVTLTLAQTKLALRLIVEESFEAIEACFDVDSDVLKRMRSHKDAIQFTLAHETTDADLQQDSVELLDGLCDTIVVAMGMAAMAGLPLNEGMDEVNRSNLAKIDPETGRCLKDDGGKILKPAGWTKPDLVSVLVGGSEYGNRRSFAASEDWHDRHQGKEGLI